MTMSGTGMRGYKGLVLETLSITVKLRAIAFAFASTAAAQATATVAGSVNDAQGAAIPGAAISLISETRGTTFPWTTRRHGRLRHYQRAGRHLHG